ncbi:MAG: hypothetical protein K9L31_01110 [Candidatus Pacebacteria bacterium]|nr:hypothetical protein [Candidatus Paceibacterota bacterium]
MIKEIDGKKMKLICPQCSGSNIGGSGLGSNYLHCFGHCMTDIPEGDILTTEALPEEIPVLSQDPY